MDGPLDTVVRLMRKASTTTGLQTTVNVIHRTHEIGRKVADSFKTARSTSETAPKAESNSPGKTELQGEQTNRIEKHFIHG